MTGSFQKISYMIGSSVGNTFLLFDLIDQKNLYLSALEIEIRQTIFFENVDSAIIIVRHYDDVNNFKMIVLERDGTYSDFCGNGARVVSLYLSKKYLRNSFCLVSRKGYHSIKTLGKKAIIHMGRVTFELNKNYISLFPSHPDITKLCGYNCFYVEAVEPHLVIINPKLTSSCLLTIGLQFSQWKDCFPRGININLISIINETTIFIKTFERGVNAITLSCGTGATSCAALCRRNGLLKGDRIKVLSLGGAQDVIFLKNGSTKLVGEANFDENSKSYLFNNAKTLEYALPL